MWSVQRIQKLDLSWIGPLGTGVGNDAAVNGNEHFGDAIVLQVSFEPHQGFVSLEGDRSRLLLSSRWLPSQFCYPFWYHYQTHFGTFHYKSNQGTCEVPGGEGSTSVVDGGEDQWGHQQLFTKANFDVRERLVSEKMFLF